MCSWFITAETTSAPPRAGPGIPEHLTKIMTGIMCRAGHTQLRKVLVHAQKETRLLKVGALIFIGDALEEDEDEIDSGGA